MTLKRFPSSIRSNYFTNAVEQDFLLAHALDRIGRGSNDMRAPRSPIISAYQSKRAR